MDETKQSSACSPRVTERLSSQTIVVDSEIKALIIVIGVFRSSIAAGQCCFIWFHHCQTHLTMSTTAYMILVVGLYSSNSAVMVDIDGGYVCLSVKQQNLIPYMGRWQSVRVEWGSQFTQSDPSDQPSCIAFRR